MDPRRVCRQLRSGRPQPLGTSTKPANRPHPLCLFRYCGRRLSARRRSCTPGRKRSECYFAIRQSHRLDPQHTNLSVRPLDIPARLIPCPPDTEYLEETLSTSLAYQTINPATGEVLKQYPIIVDNDVEVIANRSNEAFTT